MKCVEASCVPHGNNYYCVGTCCWKKMVDVVVEVFWDFVHDE